MIWELDGLQVGHWTDQEARTGCTVVLCDPPAVASGEVRGSSPATREFTVLDPLARVERVDAVVLSGGSAFGLAAADGVVSWCEERDRGFPTTAGRVPIVVAMALFDLAVGDAAVRPGPAEGRAACDEAPSRSLGRVGAATGASIGSWRGPDRRLDGALVGARERSGGLVVAPLLALNPWGDVAGHGWADEPPPTLDESGPVVEPRGNTVIGVVATNAALDKVGCHHVARAAHDGLARAVTPPHAMPDGDAIVALSTGQHPAALDEVRLLTVRAVDRAIRSIRDHR